ncbi:MAG TPA: AhpC/TSA family protein, partial [Actinomycetota bacterium]|nr:AhpC/TSA family protein [Actinomycetota bacterium]
DRERKTHRALELKRGNVLDVAGPKQVARGLKAFVTGTSAGRPAPKQDVLQLGGALVVAPGGEVLYRHQATGSEDNAPVDALLEALP